MRFAMTAPVVERSTKRRTRLPSITPSAPVATASTMSGVGRLAITVSTVSATSRTEPAACAPSATSRSIASRLRVEHGQPMPGFEQTAGHGEAHIAQTDEADVHMRPPWRAGLASYIAG